MKRITIYLGGDLRIREQELKRGELPWENIVCRGKDWYETDDALLKWTDNMVRKSVKSPIVILTNEAVILWRINTLVLQGILGEAPEGLYLDRMDWGVYMDPAYEGPQINFYDSAMVFNGWSKALWLLEGLKFEASTLAICVRRKLYPRRYENRRSVVKTDFYMRPLKKSRKRQLRRRG